MQKNPESSSARLSYGSYLQLDKILNAQAPRSPGTKLDGDVGGSGTSFEHDEMLFITVHQAHELWFKQILHELHSVMGIYSADRVEEANIGLANARLERIVTILEVLHEHMRVLETMTPMDFLEFRNYLSPASGFQSVQFRLLETLFGVDKQRLAHLRQGIFVEVVEASEREKIEQALGQPSLFELIQAWLERTPFLQSGEFSFWKAYKLSVEDHLERERKAVLSISTIDEVERSMRLENVDKTLKAFMDLFDEERHQLLLNEGAKRLSLKATHAALFIYLYREQPLLQGPYRLLTLLTKIDAGIRAWRVQHADLVHRMLGIKMGTGGSSGYAYLQQTVAKNSVFSDLCDLSTFLLPRSSLPALPPEFLMRMSFH